MFDSKYFEQFGKGFDVNSYVKNFEEQQKMWYENFKKLSKESTGGKSAKMFEYVEQQNEILKSFQDKVKAGLKKNPASIDVVIDAMKEMHFAFINSQVKIMNENIEEFKTLVQKSKV